MRAKLRSKRRLLVPLLAISLLALTTGTVAAQVTANFDLGCRAALTAGGGVAVAGSIGSISAVGEWEAGTSTGAAYGVRSGYLLPIPASTVGTLAAGNPAGVLAAEVEQNNSIFIPFLSKYVQIFRTCQY